MSNEERDRAIRELQNSINVGLCPDIESRKAAIKALSQQTEDAISRQAALRQAINAYKMAKENGFDFEDVCEEYLNVLPPVKPQEPRKDANANQHNSNALNDVGQRKNALEDDAISRQAALDAFGLSEKTRKYGGDHSGYDTMMLYEIQRTLEDLPPVTPKQRTGHNCNEDYADCDQFVCSECGIELQDWHRIERDEDDGEITCHEYVMKYCPNCGARMVEPHESEEA